MVKKVLILEFVFLAVCLALAITSYAFMLEVVELVSIFGHDERMLPYCVWGIVFGALSFGTLVFSIIYTIKILDRRAERKGKKGSFLLFLAFLLAIFGCLNAFIFAFSGTFGCVSFLF